MAAPGRGASTRRGPSPPGPGELSESHWYHDTCGHGRPGPRVDPSAPVTSLGSQISAGTPGEKDWKSGPLFPGSEGLPVVHSSSEGLEEWTTLPIQSGPRGLEEWTPWKSGPLFQSFPPPDPPPSSESPRLPHWHIPGLARATGDEEQCARSGRERENNVLGQGEREREREREQCAPSRSGSPAPHIRL